VPRNDVVRITVIDMSSHVDVDAVRPVVVGTIVWLVAALIEATQVLGWSTDRHIWRLGICLGGAALGLLGALVVIRRKRRLNQE